MTDRSLVFIYNPTSGKGSYADTIRRLLPAGLHYEWHETTAAGDAERFAKTASKDVNTIVIAIGGDGTVHEVINGLMAVPSESRAQLGIIPVGSGNDFAFAAGLPVSIEKAIERLLVGSSSVVDVGSIQDGKGRLRYWCNTVGFGLNARIALRASRSKWLTGVAKYVVATLITILTDKITFEAALNIDNRRLHERITLISLGNGPREGGAFLMTPGADIHDGRFDLLLVKPLSRFSTLMLLPGVPKGKHVRSRAVHLQRCSRLEIRSAESLTVHMDGEIFSTSADRVTSVAIQLHSSALRVIS